VIGHVSYSPDYIGRPERWEIRSFTGMGQQRMWLCSECKGKIDRHDKFCRHCGVVLVKDAK